MKCLHLSSSFHSSVGKVKLGLPTCVSTFYAGLRPKNLNPERLRGSLCEALPGGAGELALDDEQRRGNERTSRLQVGAMLMMQLFEVRSCGLKTYPEFSHHGWGCRIYETLFLKPPTSFTKFPHCVQRRVAATTCKRKAGVVLMTSILGRRIKPIRNQTLSLSVSPQP